MLPTVTENTRRPSWTLVLAKAKIVVTPEGDDVAVFKFSGTASPRDWSLLVSRVGHLGQSSQWDVPLCDESVVQGLCVATEWTHKVHRGAVLLTVDDPETGDEWASKVSIRPKMVSLTITADTSMCREQMQTVAAVIDAVCIACARAPMGLFHLTDVTSALDGMR